MKRAVVSLLVIVGLFSLPMTGSAHGGGGHCDFDDDGYDDLAIGTPYEDIGTVINAGAVNVIYGSASGLSSSGSQLWSQESAGVLGDADFSNWFGASVECGDFDADGYDDLAIGSPGVENRMGAIHVLFGSAAGLTATGTIMLQRGLGGVNGTPKPEDQWGRRLASGDFNGDGFADLAVGVPYDKVSGQSKAGSVQVFYGYAGGLSTSNDEIWHRSKAGVKGAAQTNGLFGYSLAAGDLNGDSRDDLVIGSPGDIVAGRAYKGSVSILFGGAAGLKKAGDLLIHRNKPGVAGSVELTGFFGGAVAFGDFDGDGFDDLVVGSERDRVSGAIVAGSIHVFRGGPQGPRMSDDKIWHRGKAVVQGEARDYDQFGSSLATGDFNGDSRDDLAIGVAYDDFGGVEDAGSTHVFYGSAGGLSAAGNRIWHEDRAGINGTAEEGDHFGWSLSVGDYDANNYDDLANGVPFEDSAGLSDTGKVSVIYAALGGLSSANDQVWTQDSPSIGGIREQSDDFGYALNGTSGTF